MKAYKFLYMDHEEVAIIANNYTYNGTADFQLVLLDGENNVVYNADSTQKCLDFMGNYEVINL